MQTDHDRIPEIALDWHRAGRGAVLATVTETWGSAPRGVGSQLVVAADGDMMGSVSGGCVEGAVIEEARAALRDGAARHLTYGVSDGDAFAVGLACGGTIRVLVEPVGAVMPESILDDLVAARAGRRAVACVADLATGTRRLVDRAEADPTLAERFRADRSGIEGEVFFGIHNPPLRLIVVGAVHIAQSLLPMARIAGYQPLLIDPRGAFGSQARFPGETIFDDWPDEAMVRAGLDARTAVVTLTHDPKLDDPAIRAALASDVFYLGCLGSTRTHEKRLARLRDAGVPEAAIGRIRAPVGLNIGSRTPAEIAVSILGQIIQTLRQG